MRSAGCIVNDIADQKYDKKVSRTKNRPIASGKISINLAITYVVILCSISFIVLVQFNLLTILLALFSMPLAFTYPLMKRFTYWPQLFLGITFNYGLLLGWTSVNSDLNLEPILFYLGAIFWTIGYDTIYGFQDILDDEIIGVKSTSLKFRQNPKFFLTICYTVFLITYLLSGILMDFNIFYFLIIAMISLNLYYFQIYKTNLFKPTECLKTFKTNNFLGMLVLVSIIFGKL